MSSSENAKQNILRKLRAGLEKATLPMPFPEAEGAGITQVFTTQPTLSPEEIFATEFIRLGGKFIFCENEAELIDHIHVLYDAEGWNELLCADVRLLELFHRARLTFIHAANPSAESADACITGCDGLVARTGSVLLSSAQHMGRVAPVFYPVHIIVAYARHLMPDLPEALREIQSRYGASLPSMINLNTGASRTSDIEKTLVVGVHGPKEVYCFFIND